MQGAWNSHNGRSPLAARLADLSLRAQRLIVLHRFKQLEAMIQTQAPELRRVPGGAEALTQAQAHLQTAQHLLRETPTMESARG